MLYLLSLGESRDLYVLWIPAFAGMTEETSLQGAKGGAAIPLVYSP